MMSSNLQESEQVLRKTHNACQVKSPQYYQDCQDCRYRHKGICNVSLEFNTGSYINLKSINPKERIEIMTISKLEESEPVLNLKNLFYEIEINNNTNESADYFPQKAKYESFKLLTDIQRVLQKRNHLTNKDRLNYCNTQRYFMKLYLREINKPT